MVGSLHLCLTEFRLSPPTWHKHIYVLQIIFEISPLQVIPPLSLFLCLFVCVCLSLCTCVRACLLVYLLACVCAYVFVYI